MIHEIVRNRCAKNVRLCNSVALCEEPGAGHLDLLVDIEKGRELFDFIAFLKDVEELLGCKVDVETGNSLSPLNCIEVLIEALRV